MLKSADKRKAPAIKHDRGEEKAFFARLLRENGVGDDAASPAPILEFPMPSAISNRHLGDAPE